MSEIWDAYVGKISFNKLMNRDNLEMMRLNAYYTILPHTKKGRLTKPSQIMPFAWDTKDEKKWTKADIEKLKKEGHPIFSNGRK